MFFSCSALICALKVAQSRNPVYGVINLVLLFCNAAGLLLMQGMEFFALLQIIVYVGALSVMFLFVVMLLNISLTEIVAYQRVTYYTIAQGFLIWFIGLLFIFPNYDSVHHDGQSMTKPFLHDDHMTTPSLYSHDLHSMFSFQEGLLSQLSAKLYVQYADLLILASLILLVAMMGAVLLALKKQSKGSLQAKEKPELQRDFRFVVGSVRAEHSDVQLKA